MLQQNHVSVGMKAPDFKATTTFGPLCLSDFKGSWVVLFSHPGDFTPVCTTEFISFAQMYPHFYRMNTQLIGLSIDSNPSHLAWVHEIKKITGISIPFPVIADRDGSVASLYGMIAPGESTTETVRNVFIIDPEQTIQCILIYPLSTGRYIPEVLRIIAALQTTDEYQVVTPANWQPGQPVLVPPPKTYCQLLKRDGDDAPEGLNCKDWFLCYKNDPCKPESPEDGCAPS